ncbi:MAG: hypothetical protein OXG27_15435 [Chloroflexi bacterium]|nr:hypothetical protein [Chloroflexota bacterium]
MEQAVPVAVEFDHFLILGAWLVAGIICSIPASAIMGAKGQNAGAGFFLGFFLNFLGIGLAIVCPASPERQAQAIARALSSVPLQTKPDLTEPVETRPQLRQPVQTIPVSAQQRSADAQAAERSQEIAELIRKSQSEQEEG